MKEVAGYLGVMYTAALLAVMFVAAQTAYDRYHDPIAACIQGGMTRMYTAAMSLEELRKGQENVVSWCRTGELVHK